MTNEQWIRQMAAVEDPVVADDEEVSERFNSPWRVTVYDDDIHTFDEVITQICRATGASAQDAERMAWTIHNDGKCDVFEGSFEDCLVVQGILKQIQLVTDING